MSDGGPKPDPRQSILERFRRDEITREEADAEARACGFASLEARPDPSEFDPLAEPFWTVPMALAWIIYGSADSVRELMESYRAGCLVWRHTGDWPADGELSTGWRKERKEIFELLPPERMDIFDVTNNASRKEDQNSLAKTGPIAREEFWRAMELRTLIAEGIATGQTSHKPIRDAEWETFSWQPDPSIPEDALAGWWEKEPRYRRVFVRSADVIKLWPALHASDQVSVSSAPLSQHAVGSEEAMEAQELLPHPNDEKSSTTSTIETTKPVEMRTGPEATDARATRTYTRIQAKVRKIATALWPTGEYPARNTDRDNSIIDEFKKSGERRPPSTKTIRRALKEGILAAKWGQ